MTIAEPSEQPLTEAFALARTQHSGAMTNQNDKQIWPRKANRRQVLAGIAGVSVVGLVNHLVGRREYFSVTESELRNGNVLPVHDGVRVAHLTDVHVGLGTPDSRIRAAVDAVNDASPDIVVITGDLVTSHIGTPLHRLDLISGIKPPTFVTLGNHDYWRDADGVRKRLEGYGYSVLRNERASADLKGSPVVLLGVDDGCTGRADVGKTLHGAPEDATRIVLAHTPPTADELPAGGDLICLAGHTHGGQFVLPWITHRVMRSLGQPYAAGFYAVNGNSLYVNRGLGFGRGGPPRFRADPEVAIFTLRPRSSS